MLMNIKTRNSLMRKKFHNDGFNGENCVVAVLDTAMAEIGNLRKHIDFADSYRVDDRNTSDHGVFVASQILEWAPNAQILSYCVFPDGSGKSGAVNAALSNVLERAKQDSTRQYFVNMSLASNIGRDVVTPYISKMHALIKELVSNNIPVFVAAGNDGGEQLYIYPSRFQEPICVGSVNVFGGASSFSTWHDELDAVDDGEGIIGIDRNGLPTMMSGTSMACPNLLGKSVLLACKMRADNGAWPSEMELYNELKECAIDCESVGYDIKSGYGFVDIRNCDGAYKSADGVELPEKTIEALKVAKQLIKNIFYKVGNLVKLDVSEVPYSRVVKVGITPGDDVKAVKDKLLELGYLKTAIKPTFGWESAAAVKKFQQDHGLKVDGKVGPITWNALFNVVTAPDAGQPEEIPLDGTGFDVSLIPPNISRAKAAKIAVDLAGVSEVRRNMVLDALKYAVDPSQLPPYMYSFYGRGKNLYNNDLTLNVATKAKMDGYFRNANYAPYYDGGRQEVMEEAALQSNYTILWSDCSGEIAGLLKKHCASMIDGVKKLVSSGFDSNANTFISRYATPTSNPKPGDFAWRDGHIGLYCGGGIVVEHVGGAYGCAASEVSNRRIYSFLDHKTHKMGGWSAFGKPVFYD